MISIDNLPKAIMKITFSKDYKYIYLLRKRVEIFSIEQQCVTCSIPYSTNSHIFVSPNTEKAWMIQIGRRKKTKIVEFNQGPVYQEVASHILPCVCTPSTQLCVDEKDNLIVATENSIWIIMQDDSEPKLLYRTKHPYWVKSLCYFSGRAYCVVYSPETIKTKLMVIDIDKGAINTIDMLAVLKEPHKIRELYADANLIHTNSSFVLTIDNGPFTELHFLDHKLHETDKEPIYIRGTIHNDIAISPDQSTLAFYRTIINKERDDLDRSVLIYNVVRSYMKDFPLNDSIGGYHNLFFTDSPDQVLVCNSGKTISLSVG